VLFLCPRYTLTPPNKPLPSYYIWFLIVRGIVEHPCGGCIRPVPILFRKSPVLPLVCLSVFTNTPLHLKSAFFAPPLVQFYFFFVRLFYLHTCPSPQGIIALALPPLFCALWNFFHAPPPDPDFYLCRFSSGLCQHFLFMVGRRGPPFLRTSWLGEKVAAPPPPPSEFFP